MDNVSIEDRKTAVPVSEHAVKAENKELSPEETEKRYLELLKSKVADIEREVCTIHEIENIGSAPLEKKKLVILELKRRVFDLLEEEQKGIMAEKVEQRISEGKSEEWGEFLVKSMNWYNGLDKEYRINMLAILGTAAGYLTGSENTGTPARKESGEKSTQKLVEVEEGHSLWSILKRELSS